MPQRPFPPLLIVGAKTLTGGLETSGELGHGGMGERWRSQGSRAVSIARAVALPQQHAVKDGETLFKL